MHSLKALLADHVKVRHRAQLAAIEFTLWRVYAYLVETMPADNAPNIALLGQTSAWPDDWRPSCGTGHALRLHQLESNARKFVLHGAGQLADTLVQLGHE